MRDNPRTRCAVRTEKMVCDGMMCGRTMPCVNEEDELAFFVHGTIFDIMKQ